MARPRTHQVWKGWVWRLHADNPKLSAVEIGTELTRIMETSDEVPRVAGPPPAARTIRGLMKEQPTGGVSQFASVRWPESFGTSDLPWEAAELVLDLIKRHHAEGWARPTVSRAKWLYRTTLAAPDMPAADRFHVARYLELGDTLEPDITAVNPMGRLMEWYLAYEAWVSVEAEAQYRAAAAGHDSAESFTTVPLRDPMHLSKIREGSDGQAAR